MRTPLFFIATGLMAVLLTSACELPSAGETPTEQRPQEPQETQGATGPLTASNCRLMTTAAASASGDDGVGSVAANSQDDNLATRWSGQGVGSWLRMDLGSVQSLTGAAVAWHRGNERQNHFTLSTSEDGVTYTQVYAGTSTLTAAAQTYAFPSVRRARYVRVTVNGNTVNDWASISEARACGEQTVPTPSTADSGPALPRTPYLQNVGTTSALVAFRTGVSCTPYVRFGAGTDLSRTATATAAGWRHAVKLDGLSAGQTYSYVVHACGSVTGVRQFRTATEPSTLSVHFTAMGDFGTGGSTQAAVLKLLTQPGRAGELLLALGDNAYSSGTEQEFQDRMFKPMAALLREVPLFATLGNHEHVTSAGQPYLDNFYLPANNPARTERYYSFDWGPVHFVALDSTCAVLGSVDVCKLAVQKSWVAQDLAATKQPWKVVFFHHPPWSSGDHGSQLAMRREFGPLFEQYGVDLVLTGHDHNYERTRLMKGDAVAASGARGITYVVVGSGGASLRSFPGSQPSWTAYRNNTDVGYLDVKVSGGTLTARFFNAAGAEKDRFSVTKTLPAALPSEPVGVSAAALETAPGPVDDPAHAPEGLRFDKELLPADSPEAVADDDPVSY
jgi:3',5'-cyclic AMP phosphodiesterase CpdA